MTYTYRVNDHEWSCDVTTFPPTTCCEYPAGAHNPLTALTGDQLEQRLLDCPKTWPADCAECDAAQREMLRRAHEAGESRINFLDELAGLLAGLIQAGVTEDEVRADFEAQMSLQMWTDKP